MTIAVSLENVHKAYRLYDSPSDRLWEMLGARPRHREIKALDGVDLQLEAGRVLGLIGENGAGKTTLLKLVSGVTEPTQGQVRTAGTVASILELGAAFHGELTGRENARLNAAVLGVPKEALAETLARTLEFSELGDFFERPVKTYSSGMVMRLAFTIATEVDPEILVVDEALAVGDGHFQKKSADRITAFRDRGRTILFCSHAMYFVTTLCDRAVWLRDGKIAAQGLAGEVVQDYEAFLLEKEGRPPTALRSGAAAEPPAAERPKIAWIESARVLDGGGGEAGDFSSGEDVAIEVKVRARGPEDGLHVRIGIDRVDNVQLFATDTRRDGRVPLRGFTAYRVLYRLPRFPARSGEFSVFVYVGDDQALVLYDHVLLPRAIRIRGNDGYDVGIVELERAWEVEAGDAGRIGRV